MPKIPTPEADKILETGIERAAVQYKFDVLSEFICATFAYAAADGIVDDESLHYFLRYMVLIAQRSVKNPQMSARLDELREESLTAFGFRPGQPFILEPKPQ